MFLLLPVQAVPGVGGKTLTWCTAAQSKKYEKVAHRTQQPCWLGTRYPSSCNQSLRSRYFDLRDNFLMVLRPENHRAVAIKFCKTCGFPEKDTMALYMSATKWWKWSCFNFPEHFGSQLLSWHHPRPQIPAGLDLELHPENDEHLRWKSQRSSRVEVGRCFWCQQKDAEHVVEVTFVNIGSIFCCKYKSRWKMIENDRTLGILGVVFHGLSVTPLNGSSSVATSFRQWCTRVDVQLSESLSKWSKFQLQNSFQDICWESRQIEVDWKSFQVLDNSAVIQVDRSSLWSME